MTPVDGRCKAPNIPIPYRKVALMKREFHKSARALILAPLAALCLVAVAAQAQTPPAKTPCAAAREASMTMATVDLKTAMRTLWEEHITYTRNYIISALADLPDRDAVAERLLSNQDDIGNAIKPYYGEAAGEQLSTLLRDHIVIATGVVGAAKDGDKAQLADAQAKWSANGQEIAAFLSGANPNWPAADLEEMLQQHLDLTSGQVVARLNKNWAADIQAYDDGHAHMLMFADALTEGIAQQFPDKFQ
jgi:phage terminase Nu1 subunit (DNA packaging protein)